MYTTIKQVRLESGFTNNTHIIDVVVTEKIVEAQAEINGYLDLRYTVPFTEGNVPPTVARLTREFAACLLLIVEYSADTDTGEEARTRLEKIRKSLMRIANGEVSLFGADGEKVEQKTGPVSGWPDNSTASTSAANSGGKINFRISENY